MGWGDSHENVPYVEENMRFFAIAFGTFLACLANSISGGTATAHHLPWESPISSAEFLKQCMKGTEWCEGYVSGMVEGMSDVESMNKRLGPFCLPKNINTDEMTKAVMAYLDNHPSKENEGRGSLLVMDALHVAYPCKAP